MCMSFRCRQPTLYFTSHVQQGIVNSHLSICSGENRQRYFQRLINGSYTPLTLPVGGEEACEVSPRSLAEALLVKTKTKLCYYM